MGRLFFIGGVGIIVLVLLFFPIYLTLNLHYDMNRKKFCFLFNLYKTIKIIGGYITPYPKGVALHVSPKKAILLQYKEFERETKKISFFKSIRLYRLAVMTETGANYLLGSYFLNLIIKIIVAIKKDSIKDINTNIWLENGDIFRVSIRAEWYFNGYTVLKELIKVLKEKMDSLWKKKATKSIV